MTYDRAKLETELVRDEDERFRVYRCTEGKQTIGVGRNLDARRGDGSTGLTAEETRTLGITRASCLARGINRPISRALLANDIESCERDLDRALPWWRGLDAVRQRALMNMVFNMGLGTRATAKAPATRLLSFEHGSLRAIREGRWGDAAASLRLSRWHNQVHARADRLIAMILTGKDPA
jgi:lysozyme